MAKTLLINLNRWGRGITTIWITSHAATLKSHGHEIMLFDASFCNDWRVDEISYNTNNLQYTPTDYKTKIKMKYTSVFDGLAFLIQTYNPDIIFWSAVSSHINGEGEYKYTIRKQTA